MILKHQIRFLIFNICFFIGAYCNAENNSRSAHVLDTVPSNEKLYTTNQLDILPFLVCKYQRDTENVITIVFSSYEKICFIKFHFNKY